MEGYMSTREAMEALGVGRSRVIQLIKAGILDAEKVGNGYVITEESIVARLEADPKPGNPQFGPEFWENRPKPVCKPRRKAVKRPQGGTD